MAIAKGRNKELEDFVYDSSNNLQFVIPSICLMETLVAIEREEKRSQSFSQTIQIEMNEAKRNKELNNSQSFVNYLESSLIDYDDILTDFKKRFLNIIEYLKNHGELIEPSIKMLADDIDVDDTPIQEIKESLITALQEAKAGKRIPLEKMWEGIDAE
ncbi:PIN domain-containing protein [Dolichospermum compactum]|uniref:DUF4935 domain-containing protein n=1 Tax=Dolichospermum compactum NIES-806 TaxID=1973481 RepID=A0A1Z4UZR0_9CYAN|nr:PIN domain-containing protein [Dolichospermum compactum]BAZ84738.1 hypothetical protein NIES806_09300 [Dolichospermum compactum NIES-806]